MKAVRIIIYIIILLSAAVGVAGAALAQDAPTCKRWADVQITEHARRYQTYAERAAAYIPRAREILAEEGLPAEWLYLMLVESGGKVDNESDKGARGLWQMTAPTARAYGCTDRTDPESETRAAARYIRKLLQEFDGDAWYTIAGYNQGGSNLKKHGPTREARALADLVQCLMIRNPQNFTQGEKER